MLTASKQLTMYRYLCALEFEVGCRVGNCPWCLKGA